MGNTTLKDCNAMKKIFTKLMLLAVAATALASCAIDDTNDVATLPGVEVSINATTADARSAFGELNGTTYPTLWEGNEEWAITVNEKYGKLSNSDITFSEDGKTANAKRTFENGIAAADTYTLYLVSPYGACSKPGATSTLTINAAQTPSTTSCDPAAQVLVATATAEGNPYFETTFHHATAYGKFSFVNLNLGDATVNNVTIESEVAFVNKFTYAFNDGTLTDAGASKVLTLATDATENLWFACAPVDVSGKKLTFTINTSNGPLSKVVTMPANSVFKSGVVAQFGVDMKDAQFAEQVKWELVTDAGALSVGSQIIIVGKNSDYALSTDQRDNNRGATTITKDGNYLADPSSDVQIATLEEGTVAGTFAFNVGTAGYLYAASSSKNYLRTQTTNDANSSWKITIAADGTATIVAQGTNSRNTMQYNYNNGAPLFACYGSASQTAVCIYALPSTDPAIVASNIQVDEFGVENETASYDVKNMEDDVTVQSVSADWVTASASEKTINYSVESNYDGETRTAQIVLASASTGVTKTITVTQDADKFAVSVTAITLDAEEGAKATFTVTSSYEYSVSNPDSSKLSVVKGDNGVITVTALTANELAEVLSIGNIEVSRSVDTKTLNVAVEQKAASTGDEPAGGEVTFDFTSGSSSVLEIDPISITGKMEWRTNAMRINSGKGADALIFTATPGVNIESIVLTFESTSYNGLLSTTTGTYTLSSTTGTWVGSSNSVSFSNGSKQARIKKAVVTYK